MLAIKKITKLEIYAAFYLASQLIKSFLMLLKYNLKILLDNVIKSNDIYYSFFNNKKLQLFHFLLLTKL